MTSSGDENLPAVTDNDLRDAGFPSGMKMAVGLQVFLNDALYKRFSSVAVRMSEAAKQGALPKHLADKPAACFAILSRAVTWNLDPFAVAQSTYETPGGRIGYEGKLVQSILENSGHLEGGVRFEHQGEWEKLEGKFKLVDSQRGGGKHPVPTWTPEDAKGLSVIVSAKVKGRVEPERLVFKLIEAFPMNSPLWATAPNRQICYAAVRAFANICLPSVLMGIPFDIDPVSFYGDPMPPTTDITPRKRRATGKGNNEFDRTTPREDAEFKRDDPQPTDRPVEQPAQDQPTQQQNPEPEPDPLATQVVPEPTPEVRGTEAVPQASTVQAQSPTAVLAGEPSDTQTQGDMLDDRAEHMNEGLRDYLSDLVAGDLAKCRHVRDVTILQAFEAVNFAGTAFEPQWSEACKKRQQAIITAADINQTRFGKR